MCRQRFSVYIPAQVLAYCECRAAHASRVHCSRDGVRRCAYWALVMRRRTRWPPVSHGMLEASDAARPIGPARPGDHAPGPDSS